MVIKIITAWVITKNKRAIIKAVNKDIPKNIHAMIQVVMDNPIEKNAPLQLANMSFEGSATNFNTKDLYILYIYNFLVKALIYIPFF